jgi:8-oxo-dGTP pyrophosphatase MutT (NUDIX family)
MHISESEIKASVAMIHTNSLNKDFLLLKRNSDPRDPWSGNYAFPGGMREEADSNLYETSIRETYEECGVCLDKSQFKEKLPVRTAGKIVGKLIHVQPWRFQVSEKPKCEVDGIEIVSSHWISETILREPSHHVMSQVKAKNGMFETRGINFEGTFLWGFTYKVLLDYLGIPQES